MEEHDKIWIASKAFDKGWDYETLLYSDDLYHHKGDVDDVWEYVIECEEIGTIAFRKKYSQYKLYF